MLNVDDLKRFAAVFGRCVTIYEPLRDEYSQVAKPEVRVNAAIQEADQILAERGWTETEREETLRPLRKLRTNTPLSGRKGSLLVFRARDFTHASFWPETMTPRVHVGQQFLVLPLLPGVMSSHHFWLLTLTTKAVRLFRGSRETLTEIALPHRVPRSLAEASPEHHGDHDLESRSDAGRGAGTMQKVRFGTATIAEKKVDHLHDFFRAIDRGIRPLLSGDRQPLILAGVTRELSLYGRVNTYSPILEQAIHGCPEYLSIGALHEKAAALADCYSVGAPDKAVRDMEDAAGRGLLATGTEDILEASQLGRVEHLLVSLPCDPAHEDGLNSAVLAAFRHSGRVSVLESSRLPSGAAAILRFRETPAG
jgi:hypothetical protein